MREIVAGFDGSKSAEEALRWAADEAFLHGCQLRVMRSFLDPFDADRSQADLATAVGEVLGDEPGFPLVTQAVEGSPGHALVTASEHAELVVVGARGLGGFVGLLLGSVSQRVATRAESTVAVVRDLLPSGRDVVVGVDGSPGGRAALAWAAEDARRRNVRLRAVMAWDYLFQQGEHGREHFRSGYTGDDARRVLRAIVADVLGATPDFDVVQVPVCDLPAKALVEQAADACLVAVAQRRESPPERVHLGSVTTQVLHHAPATVVIVRTPPEASL